MLVYGHRTFRLNVPRFVREWSRRVDALPVRPTHEALVDLLVDIGEAESAVTDALSPSMDEVCDAVAPWRIAAASLSDTFCASRSGHDVEPYLARLRTAAQALERAGGPQSVDARSAEGFTQFALFPEQYVAASEQVVASHRPESLLFVGLRGIGSILAHIAAAAARRTGVPADVISVRPRGDPFDRRLVLGTRLQHLLQRSTASLFAIVDEGPGLSGSSFAAAADALVCCGIDPQRIVLLPAWDAPPDRFVSDRGRATWLRHHRVVRPFIPPWTAELADLSAGSWRTALMKDVSDWPAVQPQHERRKYLDAASTPNVLHRFAGLGRHGRSKYARAAMLADAGFGPRPIGLRDGFLGLTWMAGSPLTVNEPVTPALVERLASYASCVNTLETGEVAEVDDLSSAAECNAREALGDACAVAMAALGRDAATFAEPAVAVDGRLQPHEWIDGGAIMWKADALDHHADDFLPACRDIAWDVAGAVVEFALPPAAEDALLLRYCTLSGDRTIAARLPFYAAAYLAYRLGYATLCAGSLKGLPDGLRFRQLARRYRHSLAARLLRGHRRRRC